MKGAAEGADVTDRHSKWQTDELATAFLRGVRGAIPAAALQLELVGYIIQSWRPGPRRILDLGCGDGAVGRSLLGRYPEAQITFADFSEPMLEAARKQLGNEARATIVKADFSSKSWMDAVGGQGPFDAVVSGFAIHHQPDKRKRELYGEVFGLLDSGGLFLNLEHVAPPTPDVEALFDNYFIEHLYRFHSAADPARTREDVAEGYYNRPDKEENLLAPLQVQCEWLIDIGFTDVDCFFKIFDMALFGGRKP